MSNLGQPLPLPSHFLDPARDVFKKYMESLKGHLEVGAWTSCLIYLFPTRPVLFMHLHSVCPLCIGQAYSFWLSKPSLINASTIKYHCIAHCFFWQWRYFLNLEICYESHLQQWECPGAETWTFCTEWQNGLTAVVVGRQTLKASPVSFDQSNIPFLYSASFEGKFCFADSLANVSLA